MSNFQEQMSSAKRPNRYQSQLYQQNGNKRNQEASKISQYSLNLMQPKLSKDTGHSVSQSTGISLRNPALTERRSSFAETARYERNQKYFPSQQYQQKRNKQKQKSECQNQKFQPYKFSLNQNPNPEFSMKKKTDDAKIKRLQKDQETPDVLIAKNQSLEEARSKLEKQNTALKKEIQELKTKSKINEKLLSDSKTLCQQESASKSSNLVRAWEAQNKLKQQIEINKKQSLQIGELKNKIKKNQNLQNDLENTKKKKKQYEESCIKYRQQAEYWKYKYQTKELNHSSSSSR